MALEERTRPRKIIIDFPTADAFTVHYQEAVDLYRDGELYQELRVSEPGIAVPAGEQIPEALTVVFGEHAAEIIQSSHEAALAHEERLQEVADLKDALAAAEQQAAALQQRAEQAEERLAAVQQVLTSEAQV